MFGSQITSNNILPDYSYINASATSTTDLIARCVTGLGPNDGDNNNALGGLYFNGTRIPNGECGSSVIQPNGASINSYVGVLNLFQCGTFSTDVEGVYICTMMNSSMINRSIRLGIYFVGRGESL